MTLASRHARLAGQAEARLRSRHRGRAPPGRPGVRQVFVIAAVIGLARTRVLVAKVLRVRWFGQNDGHGRRVRRERFLRPASLGPSLQRRARIWRCRRLCRACKRRSGCLRHCQRPRPLTAFSHLDCRAATKCLPIFAAAWNPLRGEHSTERAAAAHHPLPVPARGFARALGRAEPKLGAGNPI